MKTADNALNDLINYKFRTISSLEKAFGILIKAKEKMPKPKYLDAVAEIIKEKKLNTKSRKQEIVFSRIYLFSKVRHKYPELTLKDFESVFNRDHSTLIYYSKMHTILKDDEKYLKIQSIVDDWINYKMHP